MKPVIFTAKNLEIMEVMKRTSEETLNLYVVVKARVHTKKRTYSYLKNQQRSNRVTFVCFKETLIPVLVAGKVYTIEGYVEFSLGGTYLSIQKLYDADGHRVLREKEVDTESADLSEIPV